MALLVQQGVLSDCNHALTTPCIRALVMEVSCMTTHQ